MEPDRADELVAPEHADEQRVVGVVPRIREAFRLTCADAAVAQVSAVTKSENGIPLGLGPRHPIGHVGECERKPIIECGDALGGAFMETLELLNAGPGTRP